MPSRESHMVTVRDGKDGRAKVWCDPEVADLVDALNTDTLSTVASCSGHGFQLGRISMQDGRELLIVNYEQATKIARMFPGINGEPAQGGEADNGVIDLNTYAPPGDTYAADVAAQGQDELRDTD